MIQVMPKKKAKKVTANAIGSILVNEYVGFSSAANDLTNDDKANIIHLRGLQQFESLRRFFVMSARDFYRLAGQRFSNPPESALNSRIGIYIEDMISAIDTMSTVEPEKEATDPYDDVTIPNDPTQMGMVDDTITAQP